MRSEEYIIILYTMHAFPYWAEYKYKRNSLSVLSALLLAVIVLEVCFLQNLYVTLVDLEGGAKFDRQAGQNVMALHEEERLPIDFLTRKQSSDLEESWNFWELKISEAPSSGCLEDDRLTCSLKAEACSGKPAAVKYWTTSDTVQSTGLPLTPSDFRSLRKKEDCYKNEEETLKFSV